MTARTAEWRAARPPTAGWVGDLLAAVAGGASVLAFAPFGIWPLAIVCPAILTALWVGISPGRAFLRGFLYGIVEFLAGIYWIYTAVAMVGGAPVWLGALLYVALALACAVFPGVVGYGARRLARGPGWVWLAWVPGAWILLEWVRSFLLTGFPWLALGYSQAATPLGAYAPILGVYGAGFACMLVAMLLLITLAPRRRMMVRMTAVASLVAVFAVGFGLGRISWTRPAGPEFSVSLIQGNIPQTTKWEPRMYARSTELYRHLTRAHWSSQLIVWPEDAVPLWSEQAAPLLAALAGEARMHGSEIVLGIPVYDAENGAGYNGIVSLGSAHSKYFKRHLVPFGEYFPVPDWVKRWLSAHALPYSSFTPGPWTQPPLVVGRWRAAVASCYEIAFGRLLITQLPAGEFILNLSDDGWFGRSIALPQQFQMARLAARATGRYVLAATDDGITGIIDAQGRVRATLPMHTVGVLTGEVTPLAGATPYVRVGNWPIAIFCGVLVVLAFGLAILRRLRYQSGTDLAV